MIRGEDAVVEPVPHKRPEIEAGGKSAQTGPALQHGHAIARVQKGKRADQPREPATDDGDVCPFRVDFGCAHTLLAMQATPTAMMPTASQCTRVTRSRRKIAAMAVTTTYPEPSRG